MQPTWQNTDEARAAHRHLSTREAFLRRPVALVGFMGVGKTSVGRELARLLGRRFLDTDVMVEEKAGRSIPELFREGEPVFRALEFAAVQEALSPPAQVIALGGGAFAQPDSAELLLRRAIVVHLYTPWKVVLNLLESLAEDRPLIRGREPWQVQDLFLARGESYRKAHLRVDLPRHGAIEAAEEVAMLLRHPATARQALEEG